jgi:hypothetical protein
MKVFISWSGERSRHVATALGPWLKQVIQAVRPWMSNNDILAGDRWNPEVTKNLDEISFGICCITPENRVEPWILFEAGALGKTVSQKAFVCPYLIDMGPSDLHPALAQFQAKRADKEGTFELISSVNTAIASAGLSGALNEDELRRTFEKWWPDLQHELASAPKPASSPPKKHERQILEEVQQSVNALVNVVSEMRSQTSLSNWVNPGQFVYTVNNADENANADFIYASPPQKYSVIELKGNPFPKNIRKYLKYATEQKSETKSPSKEKSSLADKKTEGEGDKK